MGSPISQQGCIKISKKQGLVPRKKLKKGKIYKFKKPGHRLYMLDVPMDLISNKWEAVAKVLLLEFTVGKGYTSGKYKVLKIHSNEEVVALSKNLVPYYGFKR